MMTADQILLIRKRWHDVRPHFLLAGVVLMDVTPKWYTADWDYGFSTVELICAGIGAMALLHFLSILRSRKRAPKFVLTLRDSIPDTDVWDSGSSARRSPSITDRVVAAYRHATYRQYRVKALKYYSPPAGSVIAVACFFVWVMGG